MAKFHLTGKGNPARCEAQPGNCPLAEDNEHYDSPEAARAAFEGAQDAVPEIVSRRANRSAMAFQEFDPREAPLSPEEEEALGGDDPEAAAVLPPEGYRDLSEHETTEALQEEWQNDREAREQEAYHQRNRWTGL